MYIIQNKLYEFNAHEPLFMNIFRSDQENSSYYFSGVLGPDCNYFYLVFEDKDEQNISLGVEFTISDDTFSIEQYQLMFLTNKDPSEFNHLFLQFDTLHMTKVYQVPVSPSFPFPVDIFGKIRFNL